MGWQYYRLESQHVHALIPDEAGRALVEFCGSEDGSYPEPYKTYEVRFTLVVAYGTVDCLVKIRVNGVPSGEKHQIMVRDNVGWTRLSPHHAWHRMIREYAEELVRSPVMGELVYPKRMSHSGLVQALDGFQA